MKGHLEVAVHLGRKREKYLSHLVRIWGFWGATGPYSTGVSSLHTLGRELLPRL